MGYSISWLAVRDKSPDAVRNTLGVRATGEFEEIPESPLLGAKLPSGWYLIFSNKADYPYSQPLAELSHGTEVVTCYVEEHSMVSRAEGWRDGAMIWSITHDDQQGGENLDVEGNPPAVFPSIRDRLSAEQATRGDADYFFDVPVEVAKALTGYRHDRDIQGGPARPFERLES